MGATRVLRWALELNLRERAHGTTKNKMVQPGRLQYKSSRREGRTDRKSKRKDCGKIKRSETSSIDPHTTEAMLEEEKKFNEMK
jgi:hypothetical protein